MNVGRSLPLLLALLLLLSSGCTRLFLPPIQPNVSLYPTVFPVSVLEHCTAVDLPADSLRAVFEHAGWNDGLSPANIDLILRGLRSRGYAELDCRRAKGPIQWIALQVVADGTTLLATAGYERRPPEDHLLGTDLGTSPVGSSRRDAYNYLLVVDTWRAVHANVPMLVEHIVPMAEGRDERWEIRHEIPLADPQG